MPLRKPVFANNEIYHLINRGVANAPIFLGKRDYQRMMETIDFYRHENPPLRFSHWYRLSKEKKEKFLQNLKKSHPHIVEISAFCLMPNHLHFLLKQVKEKGVTTFMKQIQASYVRYFNTKHQRPGHLFQSAFKGVRIETDEQLLHVSRYIHLNPTSSFLIQPEELKSYFWSSLPTYLGIEKLDFVDTSLILSYFKNKKSYEKFIFDQVSYQRELAKIKHLALE